MPRVFYSLRMWSVLLLSLLCHLVLLVWLSADGSAWQSVPDLPPITLVKLVQPVIGTPAHPAPPATTPPSASAISANPPEPAKAPVPAAPTPVPEPVATAPTLPSPAQALAPPPNALLTLEVRTTLGSLDGELEWVAHNGRYHLRLETLLREDSLPALKLVRRSQGGFDHHGLAPSRFTARQGKRAEVATNFLRRPDELGDADAPLVSFSRVADRIPLPAGVQDELSVLMQLGFLLRANPELLQQGGNTFEVPVAGTRALETYYFTLLGKVEVRSDLGTLAAWHVRSRPFPDRYSTTIEVWLAPAHNFLPIKARFDFGNASIEMLTQKISVPATADVP